MRHPAIDSLLILQDRDTKRLKLEAEIKAIPGEIGTVEAKIQAEKQAIENARTELKELETKKKLIETEIGAARDTLGKYKTQQSLVRKNDEYQALGQQIATTEETIDTLEEKELGVMFQIDEAKAKFAAAEGVLKGNIAGHEERIRNFRELEKNLTAEHTTALADVAAARTPIDALTIRLYDRIAARTQPVVVAIRGGKCSGCHLKVSGETETDARKGEKLATCDQCSRIVWWDM